VSLARPQSLDEVGDVAGRSGGDAAPCRLPVAEQGHRYACGAMAVTPGRYVHGNINPEEAPMSDDKNGSTPTHEGRRPPASLAGASTRVEVGRLSWPSKTFIDGLVDPRTPKASGIRLSPGGDSRLTYLNGGCRCSSTYGGAS